MIGTENAIFYTYYVEGVQGITHNIKCETHQMMGDNLAMNELLSVEIPANEVRELVLEITLPNVGEGGFYNMLYAE